MEFKYVRHSKVGFIVWPRTDALWHSHVGDMLGGRHIISAGFCEFSEGKCRCYGFSESLQIGSKIEDSAEMTKQFFG